MNSAKKTNKRKLLIRYLVLAACILVIAAVTVITVFAANNWFRADVSIDDNNGGEIENPNEPVIAVTTFAMPISDVNVTKTYTFDINETLKGVWEYHTGIDMKADAGTPVSCCLDGTVESVTLNHQLFGTTITVLHDNGLKTVYRFIDARENLKKGDKVKRGEVIGTVAAPNGREANDGAHLHLEVYENGVMADPEDYLDSSSK
ncbi:MAG: M23 family metallopeptidase [Clostridia bacterium]|nr:M23 family metallopeptidase [Clostridia bacterium]